MPEATSAHAPDLTRPRLVHVVGIGGAGMSAIASVLSGMGHRVTGSDSTASPAIDRLRGQGIEVHVGHAPEVASAAEMLAVSSAIPHDDPEIVAARQVGTEVWARSAILAAICRQRRTVAVSGTHGKTTTASMLAVILSEAGWHPSVIVGGEINGIGPGSIWDPAGDWIVVEADESDGTFIQLGGEAVVVTSISSDHLDHYGTREQLDRAFTTFVTEAAGPAIVCADDAGSSRVAAPFRRDEGPSSADTRAPRLVTYGRSEDADIRIEDVSLFGDRATFSLRHDGTVEGPVRLAVPGEHNVLNATAALAVATAIGVSWSDAVRGTEAYSGVRRRFETRGTVGGVTFVDDYAHNPEKVHAALATARLGPWGRVIAVFQPHRYSRTESLWREFGAAIGSPDALPDVLVVTDVYPAGEQPRPGVSGRLIAGAVREASPGSDVRFVDTLDEAEKVLRGELREGDLCLTLGAGDVTSLAGRFVADGGSTGG